MTSRIMSGVRSRDNSAEMALRRELWRRGLRYRVHAARAGGAALPGRPDLVFVATRVIVMIDGDFWHGRILREQGPAALAEQFRPELRSYWTRKITGNFERDRSNDELFRNGGWLVIRIWESDLRRDLTGTASMVETAVRGRARGDFPADLLPQAR